MGQQKRSNKLYQMKKKHKKSDCMLFSENSGVYDIYAGRIVDEKHMMSEDTQNAIKLKYR